MKGKQNLMHPNLGHVHNYTCSTYTLYLCDAYMYMYLQCTVGLKIPYMVIVSQSHAHVHVHVPGDQLSLCLLMKPGNVSQCFACDNCSSFELVFVCIVICAPCPRCDAYQGERCSGLSYLSTSSCSS